MIHDLVKGRKVSSIVFVASFGLAMAGLIFESSMAQAGEDPHAHHRKMLENSKSGDGNSAEIVLPDTELVTQDGMSVRLKSDVVADRIVEILV